jgi:signal transduction histidine kinase
MYMFGHLPLMKWCYCAPKERSGLVMWSCLLMIPAPSAARRWCGQVGGKKQVALTTDLHAAPVIADAFRLTQVITNLLSNAVHYNRPGGSVSVTVQSNDRGATFTVADTGVGIAEEDNRHLFDRFYRVDKARTRQAGGSGLGLAICKSIIDAHGGSITVHSTPGEGSTFTVHLRTSGIT